MDELRSFTIDILQRFIEFLYLVYIGVLYVAHANLFQASVLTRIA